MSTPPSNGAWTIDDAGSLYNIGRWGAGYFGINPGGRVEVRPRQEAGAAVDVLSVVAEARQRGHMLRAQADFLLTGAKTVLKDEPRFTVRIAGLSGADPAVGVVYDGERANQEIVRPKNAWNHGQLMQAFDRL